MLLILTGPSVGAHGLQVSPVGGCRGVYWSMVELDDGELYRKHADDLVALATTLVGPDTAADVVSAAVARTIASPQWLQVRDRYAYWVRAVYNEARSSYRSAMRRAAREAAAYGGSGLVEDATGPDPEVLAAVAVLSLKQRTVIYLTYWQDLPVGEVAGLLGISDGAVRCHLARARAKLRRSLV